ncbi:transglutaminase TgpA family protein [Paenibacillus physcomitrellae]|uniref:Transglutaminase-like domain-containing protein n=1 Tax=Paenibacillus physcomitrellae TaxID=1619311 RepID=A0ABQ1GT80_9BACL|nr:transglutaminaseTgpA domain-containing protein [Paenibacillus physcomitrellae]GGA49850.1 hypothetical protein GCM10010917_38940 [Paenibacillus physcomitrellae]
MRMFQHEASEGSRGSWGNVGDAGKRGNRENRENRPSFSPIIPLSSRWLGGFWCSLLLCGLFLQWLEPLRILGGTDSRVYYVVLALLTAFLLLIGCLGLPLWMTSVLSFAALCQAMVHVNGEGLGWKWLIDYGPILLKDASIWASTGSMADISQASRVLVLLTGWILLVLSVQLLAINRYTALLFLCITAIYLFAFELTAGLNMFWPIVYAFGLGLLLQFTLVYFRHAADRDKDNITAETAGKRMALQFSGEQGEQGKQREQGEQEEQREQKEIRGLRKASNGFTQNTGLGNADFGETVLGTASFGTASFGNAGFSNADFGDTNPGNAVLGDIEPRHAALHHADLGKPAEDSLRRQGPSTGRVLMGMGGFIVAFGIGASLAAAFVVPVKPAQAVDWGQAFGSMETWAESESSAGSGYSVTGYGGSDEELGSPLKLREDVYFTAESPQQTYWRGESLSYYDGRGWTEPDPSPAAEGVNSPPAEEAPGDSPEDSTASSTSGTAIQKITFAEPQYGTVPLFVGGELLAVRQVNTEAGTPSSPYSAASSAYTLLEDKEAGSAYLKTSSTSGAIRSYEIAAALKPEMPAEMSSTDLSANGNGIVQSDPSEIRYQYLQLPAALPDSVRNLGQSIVSGTTSRYEAAKAVETYLQSNYKYTLNTSIPAAGRDFVEDFLFRERAGYCDHFSTAMVILLRSQGIPARWVKGFAPGQSNGSGEYTVRYADAHSWVEVYFPGQGWVPFEPTPGFTAASGDAASGFGSAAHGQQPAALHTFGKGWSMDLPDVTAVFAAGLIQVWTLAEQAGGVFNRYQTVIVAAVLLLLLAFAFMGMRRGMIGSGGFVRRNPLKQVSSKSNTPSDERHFPGKVELLRSADAAWAGLHKRYGKLANGATAREYAEALQRRMDEPGKAEMERFMSVWEPLYYGGDLPDRQTTRRFLDTCRKLDS